MAICDMHCLHTEMDCLPAVSGFFSLTSLPDTVYPDSCHEAILTPPPLSFNGVGLPN